MKNIIIFLVIISNLIIIGCKKSSSDIVLHDIVFKDFNYFNSAVYLNYYNDKRISRFWWGSGNDNGYSRIEYKQNQVLYLNYRNGFNLFDTTLFIVDSNGFANSSGRKFNSKGQILNTNNDDSLVYDNNGKLLFWYKENSNRKFVYDFYEENDNKHGIYQFDEWSPIWMTGIYGPPQKKLIKSIHKYYYNNLEFRSYYSYKFDNDGYVIETIISGDQAGKIEYHYTMFDDEYESP